jgi:hypothetical protein
MRHAGQSVPLLSLLESLAPLARHLDIVLGALLSFLAALFYD